MTTKGFGFKSVTKQKIMDYGTFAVYYLLLKKSLFLNNLRAFQYLTTIFSRNDTFNDEL